MKIRRYSVGDRDQVIKLWRTVFTDIPPHAQPVKVLDEKLAVDDLLFVAEDRGVITGTAMAGYDGHSRWLYSVAVDRASRRIGIGKRLIEHTIKILLELGCTKVDLQVDTKNDQALAICEAIGFVVEDRISMSMLAK
jgi:ribosomal protein S18 acetylase RimI-like enzyme